MRASWNRAGNRPERRRTAAGETAELGGARTAHSITQGAGAAGALRVLLLVILATCSRGEARTSHVVTNGDPERGKVVIDAAGCGACHVVPGVRGAQGKVGPPLTDFGQRQYIAGNLVNNPENLVRWIMDPQGVEPGTAMPDLGIDEAQARDVASYLLTLGSDLGPPHLLPRRWLRALQGGH